MPRTYDDEIQQRILERKELSRPDKNKSEREIRFL